MTIKITTRQHQVLMMIKNFIEENKFPPTRQEINSHFGFSSSNSAECHLESLKIKGFIRLHKNTARGIEVL